MNPAIVARCVPFGLYIALLAAGPYLEGMMPSGMDTRWLYALQVGLVTVAMAVFWKQYSELRETPAMGASGWSLGIGIGVLVFVLWINLDFPPLVVGESEGFDPRDGESILWGLALTRLAGAALVVPVMEELFWRSFLQRWVHKQRFMDVDPATVGMKALVIASALFAVEHHLWFAGLLAGLAYGWLYIKTANLWVPILAHAVTNGLLGAWVLYSGQWRFW